MRLGVDFDNTIVCYDQLFHRVALEKGFIHKELTATKASVRNFLRETDRERAWIELQGYVYGDRMDEAEPFPGVLDFFSRCRQLDVVTCIISHKTRFPFEGPSYDLHEAARRWLRKHGLDGQDFNPPDFIYFELTKEAKLDRIARLGCTHFIDDLPEFLSVADFPQGIIRILFDPGVSYFSECRFMRAESWREIQERLLVSLGTFSP